MRPLRALPVSVGVSSPGASLLGISVRGISVRRMSLGGMSLRGTSLGGVTLGASLGVLLPTAAMADGLPQLDFTTPLTISQIVWGAIIFIVLYILASRFALPQSIN